MRRFGPSLLLVLLATTACSSGKTECVDARIPPDAVCVPDGAPPDTPLTVHARLDCGGCTTVASGCEVVREGDVLRIEMLGESCTLPDDEVCVSLCRIDLVACQTPPLPAGTYRVEGVRPSTSTVTIELEVRAGGTQTDCALVAF